MLDPHPPSCTHTKFANFNYSRDVSFFSVLVVSCANSFDLYASALFSFLGRQPTLLTPANSFWRLRSFYLFIFHCCFSCWAWSADNGTNHQIMMLHTPFYPTGFSRAVVPLRKALVQDRLCQWAGPQRKLTFVNLYCGVEQIAPFFLELSVQKALLVNKGLVGR